MDWSQGSRRFDHFHRFTPKPVRRLLFEMRDELQVRWHELTVRQARQLVRSWLPASEAPQDEDRGPQLPVNEVDDELGHEVAESRTDLSQAIHGADLVVVTGGGFICDSEKPHILKVMDRLELAIQLGKPTVMTGQGVGPVEDPELRARLRCVLPSVSLILIREEKVGRPLLESLGVMPDRIVMTGDDAIEMAYEARATGWGQGIGINLRLSHYTEVGNHYVDKIRPVLHQAARNFKAQLISIPISQDIHEADNQVIRQLVDGYDSIDLGRRRYDSPLDLIKKVGRCRLVVTGAFHAAVFALAKGIPAIGLVKSDEYRIKFAGLADEFGQGCKVIDLDDQQLQ